MSVLRGEAARRLIAQLQFHQRQARKTGGIEPADGSEPVHSEGPGDPTGQQGVDSSPLT